MGPWADVAPDRPAYADGVRWWERVGAWDDAHRFAVDAVGAVLIMVPTAAMATDVTELTLPAAKPWFFAVTIPLALAWRRTRPTASAIAVYGLCLLHLALGQYLVLPTDLVVLVALYSVTVHGPRWAYRTALVGALAGALLLGLVLALDPWVGSVEGGLIVSVVVGLLALVVFASALVRRARREAIGALRDRASRLEVERDQLARLATAAERARIAREMHDIVAHSLSVVIAQADGGRYAARHDPAAAERSLTTIAETGRAALADMRRLLGVLRPGDGGGDSGDTAAPGTAPASPAPVADLTPQPAVGDVERLVAQVRASGLRASLVHMGTPRPLPPGTGLTVFRICQESLTNVLKHAGPSPTVTVLLQWTATSLVAEITDDGRGAAAESDRDGAGQGVLGMRERAAMLGGSLTIGPRPGGGYRVRAEIPIPPDTASSRPLPPTEDTTAMSPTTTPPAAPRPGGAR